MKVYIDGKFYDERDAKISVFDHGLLYGDGVFEGIRAYNGRVFRLKEHIDRLFCSAKSILLTIPLSPDRVADARAPKLPAKQDPRRLHPPGRDPRRRHARAESRTAARTLRSSSSPTRSNFIPPELYERGMEIITVPTVRNLHSALNPAIKSLNYLNNILAKIEANNAGCEEAVMLNAEGFVAECTGDNMFIVKDGQLADAAALGRRALRHHPAGR